MRPPPSVPGNSDTKESTTLYDVRGQRVHMPTLKHNGAYCRPAICLFQIASFAKELDVTRIVYTLCRQPYHR